MKTLLIVLVVAGLVGGLLWWRGQLRAEDLAVGMPAPDFSLPDARGELHGLANYRGEMLLLYFYPKNDTPGCTKEACAFRDGYLELRQRGVQVVGVSLDDGKSHQAFAEKYKLPFPLLSDRDGSVAARYGSLWSLGPVRFAKRHSFLIDGEGRLAEIYRNVDPDTHYREVLTALDRLTEAGATDQSGGQ